MEFILWVSHRYLLLFIVHTFPTHLTFNYLERQVILNFSWWSNGLIFVLFRFWINLKSDIGLIFLYIKTKVIFDWQWMVIYFDTVFLVYTLICWESRGHRICLWYWTLKLLTILVINIILMYFFTLKHWIFWTFLLRHALNILILFPAS